MMMVIMVRMKPTPTMDDDGDDGDVNDDSVS